MAISERDINEGIAPWDRDDLADTAITPGVDPVLIPTYRYTSAEFAAAEREHLWPRVWQLACTVDHLVNPGDYYEYRVADLAVVIARGDDGELRAFQNVCRHRGNSICQGAGSGLTEFRCPWHGWTWDIDGRLKEVPSRKGFGPGLRNEDFPLFPARVDTWGPLVFVNVDIDCVPLAEFLEGVPADAAWAHLEEFRCVSAMVTPVECNWKVVAEGFSETYHVQGLHSEMLGSIDDVHAAQRLWGHHGVSYQRYGVPSPRLGREVPDEVVWESFAVTQGGRMGVLDPTTPAPPVPAGQTMRDVIADLVRKQRTIELGTDHSGYSTDQILTLSQYNLFPNITVLVWGDMLNVLVARPGPTPDVGEFALYAFYRAAPDAGRTSIADWHLASDADLGLIMGQDIGLMRTAQRGLHQPGLTHIPLSSEECRVINLHRNLERYLGISPTEMLPIA